MRNFLITTIFVCLSFNLANASTADIVVEPLQQHTILESLKTAVDYFDELAVLPESTWFSRDKKSASKDLDSSIDEIIELLDAPQIAKTKQNYRQIEQLISEELTEIAELKQLRALAPTEDTSTLTKYTPTQTLKRFTASTRGDYDLLISLHEKNVENYYQSMSAILVDMQNLLKGMGIELEADQIEVWLSSVMGDDVISMSVVFNSIKQVTQQLEVLTNDSGENLQYARRYYGMVVILHRLMLRMQNAFITKIDSDYLPKLDSFKKEAKAVIDESQNLLKAGGNKEILQTNIQSNLLTIQAIDLYSSILRTQRGKVFQAMQLSQREYQVAENTYKTVNLSSQVAQLIKQGTNTFQSLISLQVPVAQPFENAEMKEQFKKLSERMGKTI